MDLVEDLNWCPEWMRVWVCNETGLEWMHDMRGRYS